VRDALLAAAQAGPFFRLEICVRETGPGWQPARELYRDGLASLITSTARQLGTGEVRVAASILQLGFAARLWSPVLHCGLRHGIVPDLSALMVSSGPPLRLGVAGLSGWRVRAAPMQLAALAGDVVGQQLTSLGEALPVRLPAGLLRGNSASAMTGSLGVLVASSPDLAGPAAALTQALLQTEDLRGTGKLVGARPASGSAEHANAPDRVTFRRRSCCLYYRVPGGGLCGDCCLPHIRTSRGSWPPG
jgi:FhuF 2Fe-2S C-terminal domain